MIYLNTFNCRKRQCGKNSFAIKMDSTSAIETIQIAASSDPPIESDTLCTALESILITISNKESLLPINHILKILRYSQDDHIIDLTCKILLRFFEKSSFQSIYETYTDLLHLGLQAESANICSLIFSILNSAFKNESNVNILIDSPFVTKSLISCLEKDSKISNSACEILQKV